MAETLGAGLAGRRARHRCAAVVLFRKRRAGAADRLPTPVAPAGDAPGTSRAAPAGPAAGSLPAIATPPASGRLPAAAPPPPATADPRRGNAPPASAAPACVGRPTSLAARSRRTAARTGPAGNPGERKSVA